MKFLYLLSAIVFLVLMDAPGFSHALVTRKGCRRRGGECHFWRCPTNARYLDKCFFGHCCQSGRFLAGDNPQARRPSEEIF
ncbi:beta-defensin 1-like isoform X1 [Terrapene carolina triunguis]|uniref:beta-defensin 1-like isoform X1 n=1 Tax=Terrapene triunguis TaxID=2587831 RepID=UPI000E77D700|nr:beta-defensin 1-like isoform X1 [Terrapene carolina triunguis]